MRCWEFYQEGPYTSWGKYHKWRCWRWFLQTHPCRINCRSSLSRWASGPSARSRSGRSYWVNTWIAAISSPGWAWSSYSSSAAAPRSAPSSYARPGRIGQFQDRCAPISVCTSLSSSMPVAATLLFPIHSLLRMIGYSSTCSCLSHDAEYRWNPAVNPSWTWWLIVVTSICSCFMKNHIKQCSTDTSPSRPALASPTSKLSHCAVQTAFGAPATTGTPCFPATGSGFRSRLTDGQILRSAKWRLALLSGFWPIYLALQ